jgi:hypothetical protein
LEQCYWVYALGTGLRRTMSSSWKRWENNKVIVLV